MSTINKEDQHKLAMGSEHTVTIEKLAYGGAGIAHINDIVVFVPRTLPGQEVKIRISKKKPSYYLANPVEVTKKSIHEVPARCEHFHNCGGCSMQNLPYQKQLEYKEEMIKETLERLTPVDEEIRKQLPGRVLSIIPSPQVYHYRNKMEMSFGYGSMRHEERNGKRIYFDEDPNIGFHKPGKWETIIPINTCHLYDESITPLLRDVREFMELTKLPVYNPKTHKGILRTLLLRRGQNTGEQMVGFVVNAKKKDLEPLFQQFMRFAHRPEVVSLLIIENTTKNDRPENPPVHVLSGKPTITERMFDLEYEISPSSFFQTNTPGAEKLYHTIAQLADLEPSDIVLDAYCGMGTIGQYLSRFCEKVVGIESEPSAIEDALKSAKHNKIANISFYKGKAEKILQQQLQPGGKYKFSCISVDPPRAGMHPKALEALIKHDAKKFIYTSCNIATFSRDLGQLLKAGYNLKAIQPVDMFPHTAHIETVAVLEKK